MVRATAALAVLCALAACGREEPLPVGVKRPQAAAACQVPTPPNLSADALYKLALQIDAAICEEAQGSSFFFPVNQSCDEEAIGRTGEARTISLEEASSKLRSCNVAFGDTPPAGVFTTLIHLQDPHPSDGQVRDANIRLQDIARRVPLGAATLQAENDTACFQYDDAQAFRRKLAELGRYLPKGSVVQHFDGRRCASLLILRRRAAS
ncbi:MAG: hypothetical protein EON86_19280 [Brevundimonas sp.]|nr:MAG: hypothetical protein EON86_19280 [Brevundimonas sp.]